jgi:DNA-binding NarL/FixJ family response regulator
MNTEPSPLNGVPIRVALMCENPIVYKSLGPRLSADRSFEVVGTYDCTIERVPEVMSRQPHVVILGISRITHFNLMICQAIRQHTPAVRIVMLPSYLDTPEDADTARAYGVDVVIEKSIDTPALVEHIYALVKSA